MYLRIHYKYSSTSFKQRLPEEFHGNSTLSIITFQPLSDNVIGFGIVAQWSRSRPSVQMVQVRLSAKLFFSLLYIIVFRFVFVLVFNHIFPLGLFPFILTASPLQFREGFGTNVFLAINVYITLGHSSTVKAYRDMKYLESSEHSNEVAKQSPIC